MASAVSSVNSGGSPEACAAASPVCNSSTVAPESVCLLGDSPSVTKKMNAAAPEFRPGQLFADPTLRASLRGDAPAFVPREALSLSNALHADTLKEEVKSVVQWYTFAGVKISDLPQRYQQLLGKPLDLSGSSHADVSALVESVTGLLLLPVGGIPPQSAAEALSRASMQSEPVTICEPVPTSETSEENSVPVSLVAPFKSSEASWEPSTTPCNKCVCPLGSFADRFIISRSHASFVTELGLFRDRIVAVVEDFTVRNGKGRRPPGLALSLFAAEWERYFAGAVCLKEARMKFGVAKLMPFVQGIPALDVVGVHPEVRVRLRDSDDPDKAAATPAQQGTYAPSATPQAQHKAVDHPAPISLQPTPLTAPPGLASPSGSVTSSVTSLAPLTQQLAQQLVAQLGQKDQKPNAQQQLQTLLALLSAVPAPKVAQGLQQLARAMAAKQQAQPSATPTAAPATASIPLSNQTLAAEGLAGIAAVSGTVVSSTAVSVPIPTPIAAKITISTPSPAAVPIASAAPVAPVPPATSVPSSASINAPEFTSAEIVTLVRKLLERRPPAVMTLAQLHDEWRDCYSALGTLRSYISDSILLSALEALPTVAIAGDKIVPFRTSPRGIPLSAAAAAAPASLANSRQLALANALLERRPPPIDTRPQESVKQMTEERASLASRETASRESSRPASAPNENNATSNRVYSKLQLLQMRGEQKQSSGLMLSQRSS